MQLLILPIIIFSMSASNTLNLFVYISYLVQEEKVSIIYVPLKDQSTDILIKVLPISLFIEDVTN